MKLKSESKQKVLLITGGTLELSFIKKYLKEHTFDVIYAIDAGIRACMQLQISPTYIVGDFDSISSKELEEFLSTHKEVRKEQLCPQKDDTDTQHAMQMAVNHMAEEIVILGGMGTRIDHMLANISLLYMALEQGIPAYLIDSHNKIQLIQKAAKYQKKEMFGDYISFLPYTQEVKKVTLTGFQYPLQDYDFHKLDSYGLGVSNEVVSDVAEVQIEEGILICIESRD